MCTKLLSVIGCVLALSLCAAPCSAQWIEQSEYPWNIDSDTYMGTSLLDATLVADGTLNLNAGAEVGYVWLGVFSGNGTLNMYAGASALEVYAGIGTVLNFHGGWVNYVWLPTVDPGEVEPVVTVEGKDFMLQDGDGSPPYSITEGFIPMLSVGSTLEGLYPSSVPGQPDLPIHMKFFGPAYITLVNLEPAPESTVSIDIKPGSDTNPINLKSKGLVPVAVLSAGGFDAGTVDSATVFLEGIAPLRWTTEDVDGDGDNDMLFFFETEKLATVLTESSTEATLAGQTTGGVPFHGTDNIQIVPKSKK